MSDELKEATVDRAKAFLNKIGIQRMHWTRMAKPMADFANAETTELRRVLGELVEVAEDHNRICLADADTCRSCHILAAAKALLAK